MPSADYRVPTPANRDIRHPETPASTKWFYRFHAGRTEKNFVSRPNRGLQIAYTCGQYTMRIGNFNPVLLKSKFYCLPLRGISRVSRLIYPGLCFWPTRHTKQRETIVDAKCRVGSVSRNATTTTNWLAEPTLQQSWVALRLFIT